MKYAGGRIPYGWRQAGDQLEENPEEQRVLRAIRRWYSEGNSYNAIARHLGELGQKTRDGGVWHATQVSRVCQRAGLRTRWPT